MYQSSVRGTHEVAAQFERGGLAELGLLDTLPPEADELREVEVRFRPDTDPVMDEWTLQGLAENRQPLEEPYNMLAWTVFFDSKRHIEEHVPAGRLHRYEQMTSLTGAASSGIRSMTAFAAKMPYIYAGQRHLFPDPPTHPEEQLDELWHMAMNSTQPISLLAKTPGPVDLRVERTTLRLFGAKPRWDIKEETIRNRSIEKFVVEADEDGALRVTRPELDEMVEEVSKEYQDENGKVARTAGCAALGSTMEDGITMPFDLYWKRILDIAATDETLFAADLAMAYEYRRDYRLDRRAALGL